MTDSLERCKFYYVDADEYPITDELRSMFKNQVFANGYIPLLFGLDQDTNESVTVTGNTLEQFYKNKAPIDNSVAFNELASIYQDITIMNSIVFLLDGNSTPQYALGPHRHDGSEVTSNRDETQHLVHTKTKEQAHESLRCVTVVIPVKTYGPSTSTAWFNYQEEIPEDAMDFEVRGHVQRVKMPDPGQYLVIDFDAAKTLHAVENLDGNKNEFLILLAESKQF